MAATLKQAAVYGATSTSGGTITLTLGSAPTVGNVMVALFMGTVNSTYTGWTKIVWTSSTTNNDTAAYYRVVQSGDTAAQSFVMVPGSQDSAGYLYEVQGASGGATPTVTHSEGDSAWAVSTHKISNKTIAASANCIAISMVGIVTGSTAMTVGSDSVSAGTIDTSHVSTGTSAGKGYFASQHHSYGGSAGTELFSWTLPNVSTAASNQTVITIVMAGTASGTTDPVAITDTRSAISDTLLSAEAFNGPLLEINAATTGTVTAPGTPRTVQFLQLLISNPGPTTTTLPAGWTLIDTKSPFNIQKIYLNTGTPQTSVLITFSSASSAVAMIYEVTNVTGQDGTATTSDALGGTTIPHSLTSNSYTPTVSEPVLMLSAFAADTGTISVSTPPTGFNVIGSGAQTGATTGMALVGYLDVSAPPTAQTSSISWTNVNAGNKVVWIYNSGLTPIANPSGIIVTHPITMTDTHAARSDSMTFAPMTHALPITDTRATISDTITASKVIALSMTHTGPARTDSFTIPLTHGVGMTHTGSAISDTVGQQESHPVLIADTRAAFTDVITSHSARQLNMTDTRATWSDSFSILKGAQITLVDSRSPFGDTLIASQSHPVSMTDTRSAISDAFTLTTGSHFIGITDIRAAFSDAIVLGEAPNIVGMTDTRTAFTDTFSAAISHAVTMTDTRVFSDTFVMGALAHGITLVDTRSPLADSIVFRTTTKHLTINELFPPKIDSFVINHSIKLVNMTDTRAPFTAAMQFGQTIRGVVFTDTRQPFSDVFAFGDFVNLFMEDDRDAFFDEVLFGGSLHDVFLPDEYRAPFSDAFYPGSVHPIFMTHTRAAISDSFAQITDFTPSLDIGNQANPGGDIGNGQYIIGEIGNGSGQFVVSPGVWDVSTFDSGAQWQQ